MEAMFLPNTLGVFGGEMSNMDGTSVMASDFLERQQ